MIYRGWEEWLGEHQNTLIVGDSSNKTYYSIMGSWLLAEDDKYLEDSGTKVGLKDNSDSEDVNEDDGGYYSDRGTTKRRLWVWDNEKEMGV